MTRGRQPIPHQFIGGTELKRCSDCKNYLPLDRFRKATKNTSDGLRYECTACQAARSKQWRERCKTNGHSAKTQCPPGTKWLRMANLANGRKVWCRLYGIWDGMRKRCYCKGREDYPVYGGKGIKCEPIWDNYGAFRAWAVSNGYAKHLTLDRIRGDENYGPNNCRWATRQEQTYNTKSVYRLTLNGVTKLLPIWARELGLPMEVLRVRKRNGWPDEHVLTVPKGGRCPDFPYQRPGRKPQVRTN